MVVVATVVVTEEIIIRSSTGRIYFILKEGLKCRKDAKFKKYKITFYNRCEDLI